MYIKWSIMFMLCILVCGFRLTHPNFHVTLIYLWHHLRPPSLKLGISLGHPWRWVEYPLFCGYLVHGACLCIMAYSPNVGTRRFAHYRPFIYTPGFSPGVVGPSVGFIIRCLCNRDMFSRNGVFYIVWSHT